MAVLLVRVRVSRRDVLFGLLPW